MRLGELRSAREEMEAAAAKLSWRAVAELRKLGKPPGGCLEVCAAVALLVQKAEQPRMSPTMISWPVAQKMMQEEKAFLDELHALDLGSIIDFLFPRLRSAA